MLQCGRSLGRMSHAYTVIGILCAALLFGLAACEREGPMEKAGRSVDKAAKDVRDAVKK
jgi:predicted small lipoprotein YifL